RQSRFLCEKCLGLLAVAPTPEKNAHPRCPVCGVAYLPSSAYSMWSVGNYLKAHDLAIHFDDLLNQCIALARTTHPTDPWSGSQPPMNNLLEALNHAKVFVHFMSFGISEFFIGALKLLAQRIPVRGIISNVDSERTLDELTTFATDAPEGNFQIKHFMR